MAQATPIFGNSNATTFEGLFRDVSAGLGLMAEAALGTVGAIAGVVAKEAPGAAGSMISAGREFVAGVNEAAGNAISPLLPSTSAAPSPFAGLNLDGVLGGLRGCSVQAASPSMEAGLGELCSPLSQLAQARTSGMALGQAA